MELQLPDLESYHYFFVLALIVLGGLYLNDVLTNKRCSATINLESTINHYSYTEICGPSIWSQMFSMANGTQQSPINLLDTMVQAVPFETTTPLLFSEEFHMIPAEMKIYNNSHNVVLYASWSNRKRPTLFGGPLTEDYHFVNMRFRWGPNDYEGSEHMINSSRFAMELQAAFIKSNTVQEDILTAASNQTLLMLSYLFMVTPIDNPYLEPVVNAVRYLKRPMSYICIEPITLSLLIPDFSRDYYSYMGSLTFPPCTEGVRWIVKPEPLMISSRQVKQFRKLYGYNGRLETNTRPVQPLNDREVSYYD